MKPCFLLAALALGLGMIFWSSGPAASSDLSYPQVYRDLGLPELPGAKATGTGRNNSSLTDGISITLQSEASNGALRSYYEAALAERGWTLQETVAVSRMREAGMIEQFPFSAVFCGPDALAFQVNTVDLGAVRELSISVTEGSNACSP
ncbi:hypothetical protein E1180_09720 [Roseibium denhamense]|uniref:Uncharacterized protein n=1 Tax=Roseibium denhamense TaxID=76305 RepID=A0ABY1PM98_9HYPH|nr:hypothetical protein [Roseibium denhamense]MTI05793.1 hypothetical protein [Roseibium denhamense]SMP37027.1 hypothetical protein SAMN06265374_4463 [Roseibium denhamense]